MPGSDSVLEKTWEVAPEVKPTDPLALKRTKTRFFKLTVPPAGWSELNTTTSWEALETWNVWL